MLLSCNDFHIKLLLQNTKVNRIREISPFFIASVMSYGPNGYTFDQTGKKVPQLLRKAVHWQVGSPNLRLEICIICLSQKVSSLIQGPRGPSL